MRLPGLSGLVGLFGLVGLLGLQTPAPPAQGLILGRVIEGTSDRGVAGAMVTIQIDVRGGNNSQTVLTGPGGAFVFRDLPGGAVSIRTSRPGWIPDKWMGVLAEGQKLNDVVLSISRTGAIGGQVVDEAGEGIEGIAVTIFDVKSASGRRTLTTSRLPVTTDDRGVYRLGALQPGRYAVCALFIRHSAPVNALSSGSGYRVGDFALISGSGSRNVDPAPDETGRQMVFNDACYGGSGPANAQVIDVQSGDERSEINLALRPVPAVIVSGTVVGPQDRVVGTTVHLLPAGLDDIGYSGPEAGYADVDREGHFGLVGVPAGSYVLKAQINGTSDIEELRNAQGLVMSRRETGRNPKPALWAASPLSVGETGITDVTLVLREGVSVSGQIVFDGAATPPAPAQLRNAYVWLDDSGPIEMGRSMFAADGKFTGAGVMPGRYLWRMGGASLPGWSLKSIVADGVDVSDDRLEISGSDISGVVVTMTDRPTHLAGVVHDAMGAVDRRAQVVVFTTDRARWSSLGGTRRSVTSGVSARGEFDIANLPPGDYFVLAVGDRVRVDWADDAQRAAMAQAATHVLLRDGERASVALTTSQVR